MLTAPALTVMFLFVVAGRECLGIHIEFHIPANSFGFLFNLYHETALL